MKTRSIIFFLLFSTSLFAQLLDKKVSISFNNLPVAEALKKLSTAANFDYSYNAALFADKNRVTKSYKNQPLRVVLDDLLRESDVEYKVISGQIIFYKKKEKAAKKAENLLNGFVKDTLGEGIFGVRITDFDGLILTSTDADGRFKIILPNPNYALLLRFEHKNYVSKHVKIQLNSNKELQVVLQAVPYKKIELAETNMKELEFYASIDSTLPKIHVPNIFVPENVMANNADTLRTRFLAGGLFPPASSKGFKAGNEINHISVHALTDYGAGIDGMSISGLASVYRFSSVGFSVAGIGNYVGGNMAGVQIGGVLNTNSLRTDGLQIGGICNITGIRQSGMQVGGLANINRSNAFGLHVAGLVNYTQNTNVGIQIGGIFNRANNMKGIQLSGIYNTSRKTQGVQIALVNKSRKLNGVQIGLFNFADSAKYGGQIGFVNIAKNGYKQLEFSYDEMKFVDFSFRSGMPHLYSIIKVGSSFVYDGAIYRLGYGLGSEWKIFGALALNVEAETFHVTEYAFTKDLSSLTRFKGGLALNFDGLSFFGAYHYNIYATDYFTDNGTPGISIIPNPEKEVKNGTTLVQYSRGYTFGLRIHL